MLIVRDISKRLGNKQILEKISFCLLKGEIAALLGPNGAGKTTLMRCLSGFYQLDEGSVSLDNLSVVQNRKAFLQKIAYVPEFGGLYMEMTVYEYLLFMAAIKHLSKNKISEKLRILVKELDLANVLEQKCETLSKGYKRRVALAGALLSEPEFLILDEPTEGLDPLQKEQLRLFLKEYAQNHIVLISTHIMEEVEAMAQRVLMLLKGKLVCDSTPQELKNNTSKTDMENTFRAIVEEQ